MIHIISRKDAQALGMRRFFTGVECKNGHISERNTKNRTCMQCANDLQNKRLIDKACYGVIKRFSTGRFSAYDAKLLGLRDYYTGVKCSRGHIAYRRASDGKCRECIKIKNRKRRSENPEYIKKHIKQWQSRNKIKMRSYAARRKSRVKDSKSNYTQGDVEKKISSQRYKCANCLKCVRNQFHVDHIFPLSLGGDNSAQNIQILCPSCNLRKAAKTPEEWAKENGRLI